MANIKVREITFAITFDIPVFIGATGNPKGTFPGIGSHQLIQVCAPLKDDSGTLVFDHADPAKRTPLSPTFFRYRWEVGKLVVLPGIGQARYDQLSVDSVSGYSYAQSGDPTRIYFTGDGIQLYTSNKIRVKVLDLMAFLEGKIGQIELEARAIAP